MADEDVSADVLDQAPAGSTGKNPLLMIVLILNVALMGVVAFFQYSNHVKITKQLTMSDIKKSDENSSLDDENIGVAKEEKGILEPLEGFTANLAQGDGPKRYVRLNAVLKFSEQAKPEEIKARKPQIRDTIISILNSKRPQDLLKVEGKQYLKEEIKAAINTFLINGNVIDVFYVSFQIN